MNPGTLKAILIFVGLLAILLVLALIGYFTGNWNEDESMRPGYGLASAESVVCTDAETAEKIRGVMLSAVDEALKQQVIHVFEVWMKDDRDQPARARTGTRQAVKAYIGSRKGIADWQPPTCP
jgi:hypothetical protein